MSLDQLVDQSNQLAADLYTLVAIPRFDNSKRVRVSGISCSLSLEHWDATRGLLGEGLLPSALVVHRSQFEALVRSVWVLYAATDAELNKLAANLTLENQQAAKNLPLVAEMMSELATKAPREAFDALSRFKDNSWKALNSYVHAGIHPLQRHNEGYPKDLIMAVLRNANGLGIVAGVQAAVLSGAQPLVGQVIALGMSRPACMPPTQ